MIQSTTDNADDLPKKERRWQLYDRQAELLNTFLERNAISKTQYDKSLHDLTEKMGYGETK